jgi:hypothetical protein
MKTRECNLTMQSFNRTSFRLRTILAAALIAFFVTTLAIAQAKKPLTADDLIQMKKAGFDDQIAINAIAANGVSLDTSVQGLTTLKSAGVTDKVINAALSAAAPKPAVSNTAEPDKGIPDEIGAYVKTKDVLAPLPVEVVNFKTAGVFGSAISYGIKKAKAKGTVPGPNSSTQLTAPVTLVLRCADGIAPTEYQLIALESKKDGREFTEGKFGLGSASTGVDKDAIQIKFEKIARSTYRGTIAELKKGEYGILAPGAVASANGASSGKLYTFGVIE